MTEHVDRIPDDLPACQERLRAVLERLRDLERQLEPLAYVRALLTALSSNEVDLETLLPDVWIAAHPEHFLTYRREEAEAAASARRRRRERRRVQAREHSRSS